MKLSAFMIVLLILQYPLQCLVFLFSVTPEPEDIWFSA